MFIGIIEVDILIPGSFSLKGKRKVLHSIINRIKHRFNVSIAKLRKWNAKTLGKHLHPGQKLIVKASIDQPAT